jgi:hypothetical protein
VVSYLLAFPPISYTHSSSPPFMLLALRLLVNFRNKIIFYGEELLAPRPTPKLEDHPLLAVRDCLFNIFAATLHIWRPFPPFATWGRAMPWWQGTHLIYTCPINSVTNLNPTSSHYHVTIFFSWKNQWKLCKSFLRQEVLMHWSWPHDRQCLVFQGW